MENVDYWSATYGYYWWALIAAVAIGVLVRFSATARRRRRRLGDGPEGPP